MGHGVQSDDHSGLEGCCFVASIKEERHAAHELRLVYNVLIDLCIASPGFFPSQTTVYDKCTAGVPHSRTEIWVIAQPDYVGCKGVNVACSEE